MSVHPAQKAHLTLLLTEAIASLFTEYSEPVRYSDFVNISLPDSTMDLPKLTGINGHAVDLVETL